MNPDFQDVNSDRVPKILVVDDDPAAVKLLTRLLDTAGFHTLSAYTGAAGIALAEEHKPNVILLDVQLPGMDGVQVCDHLKSQLCTADIPVVFVTGMEASNDVISRCFSAGADDFLAKPIQRVHLLARVRVILRQQALRESFRQMATRDPLTGLTNRRQFVLHVTESLIRIRKDRTQSVLILADLDQFKSVNDRFGHDFGDEVILTFSRILQRAATPHVHFGRLGGEEFGILVDHCSQTEAVSFAKRLRESFAAVSFDSDTEPRHFTASFGITSYQGEPDEFDMDIFLKQADIALYVAKNAGRNRAVAYWELPSEARQELTPPPHCARNKPRSQRDSASTAISTACSQDAQAPFPSQTGSIPPTGQIPQTSSMPQTG